MPKRNPRGKASQTHELTPEQMRKYNELLAEKYRSTMRKPSGPRKPVIITVEEYQEHRVFFLAKDQGVLRDLRFSVLAATNLLIPRREGEMAGNGDFEPEESEIVITRGGKELDRGRWFAPWGYGFGIAAFFMGFAQVPIIDETLSGADLEAGDQIIFCAYPEFLVESIERRWRRQGRVAEVLMF